MVAVGAVGRSPPEPFPDGSAGGVARLYVCIRGVCALSVLIWLTRRRRRSSASWGSRVSYCTVQRSYPVCVREGPPLSRVVVSLIHLCRGGRTPTTHRQTPHPAASLAHRSVITPIVSVVVVGDRALLTHRYVVTPLLSVVVVADRRRRRHSSSTPTRVARLLRSCRLRGCVSFLFSRLSRTPSPSARQTATGRVFIR
jgi:hypothetical protein